MSNYIVKKTITVSDDDIENILSAAMQGMTYWCDEVSVRGLIKKEDEEMYVSQALTRGYRLQLHDFEEGKYHQLTLKKLLNGLAQMERLNIEEYDMYDSEQVIQYALFGKQLYS